ncbi:putative TIM-barrel fold metal-dependent hydrolase [Alkalihalobacillus xiaoxiensis]|uniref:TIM-barrel fold metal-dependent hydrolase n=1 Tax=Shouchella xiaoxiensis TaxID=766895 RepID=A0ABS2SPM0_9BACI|nr:amidohydrolase family protein [Shouchella xiaoxiensis]MBM7837468.1 putative TIM-barrel fold metal-dependent hydrolase [Shouchella xiaoxiensis]
MKIIDAHVHFSEIDSFRRTAHDLAHIRYTYEGLEQEFKEANVIGSVGMGLEESNQAAFPDHRAPALMGLNLPNRPQTMGICIGINPFALTNAALEELDFALKSPENVGIKIYLGYYPFYAYDDVYKPVYQLAEKHHVPVVFHTGDTYAENAILKYAHPLTIDEVAVQHRNVTFVMAHLGDPWCLSAAEVIYKNRNVYADLSGLIVGTSEKVAKHLKSDNPYFDHFKHALIYGDSYDRYLFGTDWPLVQVKPYIEWLGGIIPDKFHQRFFHDTALHVFPKLNQLLK